MTTSTPAATTGTATSPADNGICSVATQRAWLRGYMGDQYFWYASQGTPYEAAATLDAYFQSLLFRPTDRYSFSQTTAQFNQMYTEGRRIGFGYTLVWADAAQTQLRVRLVEPQSPIAAAGLKRGDTVVSVDGFSAAQVAAGAVGAVDQVGVQRVLVVRDANGQRTITAKSADYAVSPVLAWSVFDVERPAGNPNLRVGYLAYQQFVSYSAPALGEAFRAFAASGVKELVLDLRYNGGGSVNTARDLAHMAGGSTLDGNVFTELRFNNKHPENNQTLRFSSSSQLPALPLTGLRRILVLASGGTASASELLINGLRPYTEVVLFGETTYGKPYGFAPRDECGITYNAVNFDAVNALGVGGYTAGLPANCAAADDLDHGLGDAREGQTQAALAYAVNGTCKAPAQAAQRQGAPTRVFGETLPSDMFLK